MTSAAQTVLDETLRFHRALPELLKTIPGKWVVFQGGEVRGAYDTEAEAFASGIKQFGASGGQVVAPVQEVRATPITAGVFFGCPA